MPHRSFLVGSKAPHSTYMVTVSMLYGHIENSSPITYLISIETNLVPKFESNSNTKPSIVNVSWLCCHKGTPILLLLKTQSLQRILTCITYSQEKEAGINLMQAVTCSSWCGLLIDHIKNHWPFMKQLETLLHLLILHKPLFFKWSRGVKMNRLTDAIWIFTS